MYDMAGRAIYWAPKYVNPLGTYDIFSYNIGRERGLNLKNRVRSYVKHFILALFAFSPLLLCPLAPKRTRTAVFILHLYFFNFSEDYDLTSFSTYTEPLKPVESTRCNPFLRPTPSWGFSL
jgi:hypothetical protein